MKKQLLFIFSMLLSNYGFSQWSNDPNVNTVIASGVNDYGSPVSISDGANGIVTVFSSITSDVQSGASTRNFFAQKLSANGVKQWAASGIKLNATTNNILQTSIVTDGDGGAVIVWTEEQVYGSYQSKIFAQRLNNSGSKMWGVAGIEVNATLADYELGAIIRDPSGNYVFSYSDFEAQKNYAQKINSDGTIQWNNGIQLADTPGEHSSGLIFQDGTGYKFLWQEEYEVNDADLARYYWQRINSNGTKIGTNFLIDDYGLNATTHYAIEGAVTDGNNGIYLLTVATDDLTAKVYLQRILSNGTKVFNSTNWGIEIDASIGRFVVQPGYSYVDYGVALVADGSGAVVIGWTDTRTGNDGIYAQHVNGAGVKLWNPSDVTVVPGFATGNFSDGSIKINSDGDFMFFIAKKPTNYNDQLYVQKVSASGLTQYGTSGVLAAGRDSYKNAEMVVTGDKVILVWEDSGIESRKIYAQSVFFNGVLPVKFVDFSGVYAHGNTKLSWNTALETNNDYFEVERSEDGLTFIPIGKKTGSNNSTQMQTYTYTDLNAFSNNGVLYYRIKQVDTDGKSDYSKVIAVKAQTLSAFTVKTYPNPVIDELTITLTQSEKSVKYFLNDVTGKTWLTGYFKNTQHLDLTQFPTGVYLLNVNSGGENHIEKIVKK